MDRSKFFSLEAEVNLLGSIINDNARMAEVFNKVKPDHFYKDSHKLIYSVMLDMHLNDEPIDGVTLANRLGTKLTEIGGMTYLSSIIASAYMPHNASTYADIIIEKAKNREISRILRAGASEAENKDTDLIQVSKGVQDSLLKLESAGEEEEEDMEESFNKFIDILEKRYTGEEMQGIKCGYSSINSMINGFCRQDFIVIAARPSMGKTAVALNFAINASLRYGGKTAFFNLEMGKQQIFERMMSICTGIPLRDIKKGKFDDEDWKDIVDKCNGLCYNGPRIYDKINTLSGIWSELQRVEV